MEQIYINQGFLTTVAVLYIMNMIDDLGVTTYSITKEDYIIAS